MTQKPKEPEDLAKCPPYAVTMVMPAYRPKVYILLLVRCSTIRIENAGMSFASLSFLEAECDASFLPLHICLTCSLHSYTF